MMLQPTEPPGQGMTSSLYLPGSLVKVGGAMQKFLEPWALVCLPGVAPGREAKCVLWQHFVHACSLCLEAKGFRQCSWECAVIILQVGQSTRRELSPPYLSGGELNSGTCLLLHPREFLLYSVSFVYCLEAIHSALSCLVGVLALRIHVYLNLFIKEWD